MTAAVVDAVCACWLAALTLILAAAWLGVVRVTITRPARPRPPKEPS